MGESCPLQLISDLESHLSPDLGPNIRSCMTPVIWDHAMECDLGPDLESGWYQNPYIQNPYNQNPTSS